MDRNLDGCYFRIIREGKWVNVCFSDLTPEEREVVGVDCDGNGQSADWWKKLAYHLADKLKAIGDEINLFGS